jgi:hypothetical protein
VVGEVLPLTRFLRLVRGIMLKANGPEDVAPEIWPIALFAAVALIYRREPVSPDPRLKSQKHQQYPFLAYWE